MCPRALTSQACASSLQKRQDAAFSGVTAFSSVLSVRAEDPSRKLTAMPQAMRSLTSSGVEHS